MTLFGKLKEAFPGKFNEKAIYTSFKIYKKATIYVDHASPHIAKIRTTCFLNFPNGKLLEEYVKKNNIAAVESRSHQDVLIGVEHIDQVIKIIMN